MAATDLLCSLKASGRNQALLLVKRSSIANTPSVQVIPGKKKSTEKNGSNFFAILECYDRDLPKTFLWGVSMMEDYPSELQTCASQQDYEYIERATLAGAPQHLIAEALGMTQQQVSRYLAKIRLKWRKDVAEADEDTLLGRELNTLDLLMKEAMRGWEDSRLRGSPGDVQFLHAAARVVELRTKFVGLIRRTAQPGIDAPSPNELSDPFSAALSEEECSLEDDGVDFLN